MKNKVVIVHPDTGAKIYITDHPDTIDLPEGAKKLLNPDTSHVDSTPPELWKFFDGQLRPVSEDSEIVKRMHNVSLLPKVARVMGNQDVDLLTTMNIVNKLPDVLSQVLQGQDDLLLESAKESRSVCLKFEDLSDWIEIRDSAQVTRIGKLYLENKHQRHYLLVILFIVAIELAYLLWRLEAIFHRP